MFLIWLFVRYFMQAIGNRLERNIGNALKEQDLTFSFRPKVKDVKVDKIPFQVMNGWQSLYYFLY